MKKNLLLSVFIAVIALVLTGCLSTNTNQGAYPAGVSVSRTYTPEYDISSSIVSGEATVYNLFGIFTWGVSSYADEAFRSSSPISSPFSSADKAKQGATFNACAEADAHALFGAHYTYEIENYFVFKKIKCNATGMPGVLKSVK